MRAGFVDFSTFGVATTRRGICACERACDNFVFGFLSVGTLDFADLFAAELDGNVLEAAGTVFHSSREEVLLDREAVFQPLFSLAFGDFAVPTF